MIIYGWRGITSTKERGTFFCPSCEAEVPHAHKSVRNFFTLYFIPLIPLNKVGEYIECQRCKGTYDVKVLEYDPKEGQAFAAEFEDAVKRTMVLMMMADGVIDDEEIKAIIGLYSAISGKVITDKQVKAEIKRAHDEGANIKQTLGKFRGSLNANGKEMVMRSAIMIAWADGEFADAEKAMVREIGELLDIPKPEIKRLITEVKATG